MKKICSLKLRSYDYILISSAAESLKKGACFFNLTTKGPVLMPLKKPNIILLRSPHVNKKSRESFQFREYKAIVTFFAPNNSSKITISNFLNSLTKILMPGVSFKLTRLY